MTTTISGSQITFNDNTTQNTSAYGGGFAFRNRIINGDMRIDQRNAGASVTLTSGGIFTIDRFDGVEDTDGGMTAQQDTSAPTGFINSLKFTTTTADGTLGATQWAACRQMIEGTNISDLGWGTADAKTVTLSFWVRSSLTGTFGGALTNGAFNRSYPFTYSISVANTWEYKTVTIAGDTSGTWSTTTAIGIRVQFGLGVGSTYSGTAGAWAGAGYLSATGATSVIGTNGATWYITGVQLEKGSTATSFDYRPYSAELAMCQRYYQQWGKSSNIAYRPYAVGSFTSTTLARMILPTFLTMRTSPSFTFNNAGNSFIRLGSTSALATSITLDISTPEAIMYNVNIASGGTEGRGTTHFQNDANSSSLELSAEL
jgi:hypothetical protein